MPCSTFSKAQKLSVVTTPQRKSTLNVVNSTPVNNTIANIKAKEPVQSPIEKPSANTAVLTRSHKSINGHDLSCITSSSFNSTPKSKPKCLLKSIGTVKHSANDDCKGKASNVDLSSKSDGEKTATFILEKKLLRRSKSNLSPNTKKQHYQINQLSCSLIKPIGLSNLSMSNEKIFSSRLTRSFTKLNSDSDTSVNVNQIHNTSAEVGNKKKSKTIKKDPILSKVNKLTKKIVDNKCLTKANVTKGLIDGKSDDKLASKTKQKLPKKTSSNVSSKANEEAYSKTVSTKDNKSLDCSKNDVSDQNENALSSESCDSLSKRNSDNFYSHSLSTKPSFIRRKLYSQLSDFTDNDSVKTVDSSFLEKNNVKNVYETKIKIINNQKVHSANDLGGSNQPTNGETKRKSTNSLRTYCLRKNQRDSKVNADCAVESSKENTCQFIAGLLKDIDPKIVLNVVTNGVNSSDTSASNDRGDTIREIDENFDLFAKDAKDSGKAIVKKRKYVKKSKPQTKQVKCKQEKPKPKINAASKLIKDKVSRCISSSDSDTSVVVISDDVIENDKKKKVSEKASIAPVRHSKIAATKKIKKYAKEVNLEKVQRMSGGDYSSEENSDDSPFRMFGNKKYSETCSSEEYDSPVRVSKNKILKLPSQSKVLSNRNSKTLMTDLTKNYMINRRLSAQSCNRRMSPRNNYSVKRLNQSPFETRAYKKFSRTSALSRNAEESKTVESKTVLRRSIKVGKYIVTSKYDCTQFREDGISNDRMTGGSENFGRDEAFGFKKSIFNFDRNQSTSNGCYNKNVNTAQSMRQWDGNLKKSTVQDDNFSFNKRSTVAVDNFQPTHNTIAWNKVFNHSTKYEEFKLPPYIHNSKSKCGRLDNLTNNKFERRTQMEQYEYGNMQNDWRSRNLEPVRFKDGKLVTSGTFSETNTSMMPKEKNRTLSELKQKKKFQNVTLNFNRNNKQSASNLFGHTESFSQMNKIYPRSDDPFMSFRHNDISLFKKSSAGLTRDIRSLVHSQTVYPNAPESLFGSAAGSDTKRYKSYAEPDFCNSYHSTYKKYNHQDCLKKNVFGSMDARKNNAENSLFLSSNSMNKFVLKKNEDRNDSSTAQRNRSKHFNYKSSSGIGLPDASNHTYRCSTALQSETFRSNHEVNKPFDDVSSVNSMFKMPQEPSRKRPIADLDEESDGGCFKIPKFNESVSSFGISNTIGATLKGKENSYRDASYAISSKPGLKNCFFQQKSSLSGPISNSTFLGTTLKTSKPSGSIGFPSNDFTINKYNPKSLHVKQSLFQNDVTHFFDRTQFRSDTSKIDSSSINDDMAIENLNVFKNSHVPDRFPNTNAARNESIINKHNAYQSMSQKSDASFIVRKNNISSSKLGFTSFKVPSICNSGPVFTAPSEDSMHPSKSLQSKRLTPEKSVEDPSAVSRSVNHSPWRFAVLK